MRRKHDSFLKTRTKIMSDVSAYPDSTGYYMHSVVPGNYVLYLKSGSKTSERRNAAVLPGKNSDVSFQSFDPSPGNMLNATITYIPFLLLL